MDDEVISHDAYILSQCLQNFDSSRGCSFDDYYRFVLQKRKKRNYMKRERQKYFESPLPENEEILYTDNTYESIVDKDFFSRLPEPERLCISLVLDRSSDLEKFMEEKNKKISQTVLSEYLNKKHGWTYSYSRKIFSNISKSLEEMRCI